MKHKKTTGLTPQKQGVQLLDMYYLEARSYILETAAILDRIERAPEGTAAMDDSRIKTLFSLCELLITQKGNRAEKILNILSAP